MFELSTNDFGKCYRAVKRIHTGTVLADLDKSRLSNSPTWQTVQISENEHAYDENIIYLNHSCDPNTIIDTKRGLLIAVKNINSGEELNFFYPSTGWDMDRGEDYPFNCKCGSPKCIGVVSGAKPLSIDVLSEYYINEHIKKLKKM